MGGDVDQEDERHGEAGSMEMNRGGMAGEDVVLARSPAALQC